MGAGRWLLTFRILVRMFGHNLCQFQYRIVGKVQIPMVPFSLAADYKSQTYMDVLATDILIKESGTNVLYTASCFSEQNFQSFISSLGWNATGSDSNWSDGSGAHLCNFEHFGYNDTVLRAADHSGSNRVLGFKWGEADGVQDGTKTER